MPEEKRTEAAGNVKTVKDETADAFRQYVRKGSSYTEAFRRDEERSRKALREAARGGAVRRHSYDW